MKIMQMIRAKGVPKSSLTSVDEPAETSKLNSDAIPDPDIDEIMLDETVGEMVNELAGEIVYPACPCGEDHSQDFQFFGDLAKYANGERKDELAKLLDCEPTEREKVYGVGTPSWFVLEKGGCIGAAKATCCDEYCSVAVRWLRHVDPPALDEQLAKLESGYEVGCHLVEGRFKPRVYCLAKDCSCHFSLRNWRMATPYKWYVALQGAKAKRWDFVLAILATKANGMTLQASHLCHHTAKDLGECWSMLPVPHARIETPGQNGKRSRHQHGAVVCDHRCMCWESHKRSAVEPVDGEIPSGWKWMSAKEFKQEQGKWRWISHGEKLGGLWPRLAEVADWWRQWVVR